MVGRGEEEGGNQLEACHIMWDGLPLEGHSEGILGTFVQSNSEFRSERSKCPSGILVRGGGPSWDSCMYASTSRYRVPSGETNAPRTGV